MASPRKKLEVLFKTDFPVDKSTNIEIKEFLEKTIPQIAIKNIEIVAGKNTVKALVTSNILNLLTGTKTSSEEGDLGSKRRATVMGILPGAADLLATAKLEEKEKEIAQLQAEIGKLKEELDKEKSSSTQTMATFQEQLMNQMKLIQESDDKVKQLESQLADLKDFRDSTKAEMSNSGETDPVKAMEVVMLEKKKQYEEEKANLEENIARMSLKVMEVKEQMEKMEQQAKLGVTLQETVAKLDTENEEMRKQMRIKEEELNANISKMAEQKKNIETMKAEFSSEKEQRDKKIAQQEADIGTLNKEKTQLTAELKQQTEKLAEITAGKEKIQQELQDLQKNYKEKEDALAQVKAQLQEKENTFKAIEVENKEMTKKISEAEIQIEAQNKKIQKLESKKKPTEETKVDSEEYQNAMKEISELQAQVKKLSSEAGEKAEAVEQASILQKQHEMMSKKQAELTTALFEAEKKLKENNKPVEGEQSKISIIEELRLDLGEIIYVYKTLDTNSKEFAANYTEKKEKLIEYSALMESIQNLKKPAEKLELLQKLAMTFPFIKGIPIKADNLKILVPCLIETIKHKLNKKVVYENQMTKFKQMIDTAMLKISEYEQKMAFYE